MNQFPNAGAGLKKMYIAQVGTVFCTVLSLIPIISVLAAIAALVFAIISMVGLYGAGKDIPGCKTAFTLTIVNIVISIVSSLLSVTGMFGSLIFTIAGYVVSFVIIYLVCTSVSAVMNGIGAADVAARGESVWKINLVCYIATVVIVILESIIGAVLATVLSIVVVILMLVAYILYMIFLSRSSKALGA